MMIEEYTESDHEGLWVKVDPKSGNISSPFPCGIRSDLGEIAVMESIIDLLLKLKSFPSVFESIPLNPTVKECFDQSDALGNVLMKTIRNPKVQRDVHPNWDDFLGAIVHIFFEEIGHRSRVDPSSVDPVQGLKETLELFTSEDLERSFEQASLPLLAQSDEISELRRERGVLKEQILKKNKQIKNLGKQLNDLQLAISKKKKNENKGHSSRFSRSIRNENHHPRHENEDLVSVLLKLLSSRR